MLIRGLGIFIIVMGVYLYDLSDRAKGLKNQAMTITCSTFNLDQSRPEERMCVTPLKLSDSEFSFKNQAGKIENYSIISVEGTDGTKSNYYQFESFEE